MAFSPPPPFPHLNAVRKVIDRRAIPSTRGRQDPPSTAADVDDGVLAVIVADVLGCVKTGMLEFSLRR